MKSSGTSSWRETGMSGWLGHVMQSSSMAVRTQSSMLKYCASSAFSPQSFSSILEAAQMWQGTYCSISNVPSLSVAVSASNQANKQKKWLTNWEGETVPSTFKCLQAQFAGNAQACKENIFRTSRNVKYTNKELERVSYLLDVCVWTVYRDHSVS